MDVIGPRVLVTDAQDRPGLAAIRCVAAAGYRVTAAATNWLAPGLWSRGCATRRTLPDPREGIADFVSALEQLVRGQRHDVLVAGRDETLYVISRYRERIEPFVALGLPTHEVVERALDKACLATQAAKVGLASPDGHVCPDLEKALEAAREFGYPVAVKPVRTISEVNDRLLRFPSRLVTKELELRDAQEHLGMCIVQRRETGKVLSFAGVATERGLLGSVVSRYRRTWPPSAGNVSCSETIISPGTLTEQVEALVGGIGWRGLFELELIERHDGVIQAIDFNPRIYGSLCLARAAQAPLTAVWCAWVLGEDPQPVTARPGVRYRLEDTEVRHVLWQLRGGSYRAAARVIWPRRQVAHAYFQLRDPVPALVYGASIVGLVARRGSRELLASHRQPQV